MQNSVLKLTALAGVVGIGFLAVLQAQRGLNSQIVSPPAAQSAERGANSSDQAAPAQPPAQTAVAAHADSASPFESSHDMPEQRSPSSTVPPHHDPWARPAAHSVQNFASRPVSTAPGGQAAFNSTEPTRLPPQIQGQSQPVGPGLAGSFDQADEASPFPAQETPIRSAARIDDLVPARPGRVRTAGLEPAAETRDSFGGVVLTAAEGNAEAGEGAPAVTGDPFETDPFFESSDAPTDAAGTVDALDAEAPSDPSASSAETTADLSFSPFGEPAEPMPSQTEPSAEALGPEESNPSFGGPSEPQANPAASEDALELVEEGEAELQPFGEEPPATPAASKTTALEETAGPQLVAGSGEPEVVKPSEEPIEHADGAAAVPENPAPKRNLQPVEFFSRSNYEADPEPTAADASAAQRANPPAEKATESEASSSSGFDPFASENDPFASEPRAPQAETASDDGSDANVPAVPEVQDSDPFAAEGETPGNAEPPENGEAPENREPVIEEPTVSDDPFAADVQPDKSSSEADAQNEGKPLSSLENSGETTELPLKVRPQIRQSPLDQAEAAETASPAPVPGPTGGDELSAPDAGVIPSPAPELQKPESSEPEAVEAAGSANEAAPTDVREQLDPPPASQSNPELSMDFRGEGIIGHDPPDPTQRPQLTIEKLAPPNAVLGQPMVYSILIRNVGNSAAHQVTVEDEIPKGTQLQGTIPRAELVEKRLLWRLGTLEPGEEKKIQIRVVPIAEGQVGSIATVNFVAEVAAKTLIIAPRLRLEMSAPRQAKVGEPVVVNFKITNDGTGAANRVFLRDIIPDRLSHPGGNDLEYEVGTLPPRESRDVKLTLTAVRPGAAVNRAVITADGGLSTEAQAEIQIIGSQFTLKRTGPSRTVVGRPAVFTNIVTNDFDDTLHNAVVIETVPEGMEFAEATAGGKFQKSDRTITWHIDQIGPRASTELKATLIPQSTGTFASTVKVRDALGGEADVASETTAIGFASLALDLTEVTGTVAVGEGVAIKLHVRNRGSIAARNVQVQVAIPPELQFVSAQGHGATVVANEIRFETIPTIASDSSVVLDLAFTAQKAGDARVRFRAQSNEVRVPLKHEESIVVFSAGQ